MKIRNILINIICAIIIFQDTINKIIPISLISYIDEVLVIYLAINALKNIILEKKINKISLWILYLLILFSIIGIYSCYINSNFILKDVLNSNFLSIKFFIIIISILNIRMKYETIKIFKKSIIFYSKVVMIFAIPNFIFPTLYKKIFSFISLTYRQGFPSVCSLFVHPGTYGWFMLFVAILHYSDYLCTKNKKSFKFFIVSSLFAILSFRVKVITGLVGIIVYGTVGINFKKLNIKKILIIGLMTSVILVFSKDILIDTYLLYFTEQFGVSARQALTLNSIKIAKDYFPIGVGFGKFASWYARINYSEHYYSYGMEYIYGLSPENPVFATDTYWPSIIGETGVIGTIIFITIILVIWKRLRLRKKQIVHVEKNIFTTWGILVIIQTLIESTSEPIFNNSPQYILISCLIGICISNNIIDCKEDINEKNSIFYA